MSATWTTDFANSIGVNTHASYDWSAYGNFTSLESALTYLSLTNVRDAVGTPEQVAFNQWMAANGIKADFYLVSPPSVMDQELAIINDAAATVGFVEGPNESDISPITYNGQTGLAATAAVQSYMYNWVHSNTTLNGNGKTTPVIQASFGDLNTFPTYGNHASSANYGNAHLYYGTGNNPGLQVAEFTADAASISPNLPMMATESGFATMPVAGSDGVDNLVQAKYELNILFDDWKLGIQKTYLYELVDQLSDPGNTNIQNHFGMFNNDWTPKPIATAIHDLHILMNDPGTPVGTAGTLPYTLTGMPSTASSLLFEKSDGTFDLVVWNDVRAWSATSPTEVNAPNVPVTLNVSVPTGTVKVFDPLLNGTTAIHVYQDGINDALSLPDHPLVIEIDPSGSSFTPSPNGTTITTAAGAPIIDQVGNAWTLVQSATQGLQIAINGVVDQITSNVVLLETLNGAMVQENTDSNWYSETVPNDSWVQISNPNAPPVIGSGSDTLVVKVSEDAYQGDAQFTVSLGGKQLGGTLTATSSHASGLNQSFTFKGDFGSGNHTVAVKFLNDLYGGAAGLDRNLYIDDIIYRGVDTGKNAPLYDNGTANFTVNGGTVPKVTETGDHGSLNRNLSQTGTVHVGSDTFVLKSGNVVTATLGTGVSTIGFVGPSALTLTSGSGQSTVTADTGNNKFTSGSGNLDVTGGGGTDAYVYHAGNGLLTLEDFSLPKGDTLTIDASLQGSMTQASDGHGGTLITFGSGPTHGVDIHTMTTMPASSIIWA